MLTEAPARAGEGEKISRNERVREIVFVVEASGERERERDSNDRGIERETRGSFDLMFRSGKN